MTQRGAKQRASRCEAPSSDPVDRPRRARRSSSLALWGPLIWMLSGSGATTTNAEELLPSAQEAETGAFEVSPEYFQERVRKISLTDTRSTGRIEVDPARLEALTERLATELAAAGYSVAPPSVWLDVWREAAEAVGGVFDPRTGEPDPDKYPLVREHVLAELDRAYDVDAVARIEVYDQHVSRPRYGVGTDLLMWQGEPLRENPMAVSFTWVGFVITDTSDRTLYSVSYRVAWNRVYVNQGYEDRDGDQIPDLAARLTDALLACLHYLTGAPFPETLGAPHSDWQRVSETQPEQAVSPPPPSS